MLHTAWTNSVHWQEWIWLVYLYINIYTNVYICGIFVRIVVNDMFYLQYDKFPVIDIFSVSYNNSFVIHTKLFIIAICLTQHAYTYTYTQLKMRFIVRIFQRAYVPALNIFWYVVNTAYTRNGAVRKALTAEWSCFWPGIRVGHARPTVHFPGINAAASPGTLYGWPHIHSGI